MAVIAAFLIVFAGVALAADPGTDFRVSTTGFDGDTDPIGFNPDVAYNSTDNQYLVVWAGDDHNTFELEIYGQLLDASGNEIGSDFRISTVNPVDPLLERVGLDPAVAYNSANNEYMVVWYGNHEIVSGTPVQHFEVWGQRLGANGTELCQGGATPPCANNGDFRISTTVSDTSPSRAVLRDPDIAYNATTNNYLAVWASNPLAAFGEYEISGQLISNTGTEIGTDVRISNTGTDNDPNRDADNPAVAAKPADPLNPSDTAEYTVAWYGNPVGAAGEYEIYGQRVSATDGAQVPSTTDFRISNVGPDDNGLYEPGNVPPAIAYNSVDKQYLVTWYGNNPPLQVPEYEIFGQRLSAAGAELGTDFRISHVGTDGDAARNTFDPAVTYNSTDNEYLVAWYGDIGAEIEVCGQRVSAAGAEIGADVRLSNMGVDQDGLRAGFFPAVTYNSTDNEYLTTWYGDGLATDDEFEVFARRVGAAQPCSSGITRDPPTITSAGHSSRRLTAAWTLPSGMATWAIEAATSPALDPDGFFAAATTVLSQEDLPADSRTYLSPSQLPAGTYYVHVGAYNASSPACANPTDPACVLEFSAPVPVTIPPDPPGPTPPPTPEPPKKVFNLRVTAPSSQSALRKKAIELRATCDQACTLTASGTLSVPGASKTFRLRSVKRSLSAGKRVTLKLKLSSKVIRAARSALRKRKRVRATVRLTAQTTGGSRSTSRKVIRIKG